MPSIIQTAFAIEACSNIPAIIGLIFFPYKIISYALVAPIASAELTATAIFLARCTGVLILALTPQLLLALPNDKDGPGRKKLAYFTLGAGEAGLIPLFFWEAVRATDAEKALGAGGLSRTVALTWVVNLGSLLVWRVWVWSMRPMWFACEEGRDYKKE